jgi:acetyl-CoA carboxylase carboxyltransferase component
MGPDQLSGVMDTIARGSAAKSNRLVKEEELLESKRKLGQEVDRDSLAYRTSAYLLDDGVIDPRDTRDVLGMCLEVVTSEPIHGNPGHRGLARL